MKYLEVFEGVKIPVDLASTQKYVVLAMSDAGKTYLTLKFEEQLCDAGLFFVTLDPVGKHWALRAGKDGSTGGKEGVWVLGGAHGDVPLEPDSGALIADVVVDHPGQYVLDLSTFETNADQDKFATAFALRLFRRKARDPGFPLTVIMEEAEDFIPQQPDSGQARMKGAFKRIQKLGRNYGLGTWAVSQRAASLDKGFISQAAVLVAMRLSHNRDVDAIDEWIKINGTKEQRDLLLSEIASYEQGEATVWSPAWLKVFKKTRVLERVTFDSSASVKAGQRATAVELTQLDPQALGQKMQELAQTAKETDPKRLQKLVEELTRENLQLQGLNEEANGRLAVAQSEPQTITVTNTELVPTIPDGLIDAAVQNVGYLRAQATTERATADSMEEMATWLEKALQDPELPPVTFKSQTTETSVDDQAQVLGRRTRPSPPVGPFPPSPPFSLARVDDDGGNGPTGLARKLLEAMATFYPRELTKKQLAAFTGYRISGHFNNTLSAMRTSGWIEDLAITQEGIDAIGVIPAPPTPEERLQKWHDSLSGLPQEIFDTIVAAYPDGLSKEEIAERTGKKISGHFNNCLSAARRTGMIEKVGTKQRASDDLFMTR